MKVAVLGASGFIGPYILIEALSRRHLVAAIISFSEDVSVKHENLSVIRCDVKNIVETSSCISSCEAIICAYSPDDHWHEDYKDLLMTAVKAAERAGIERVIVIGSAGCLEINSGTRLVDTPQFPEEKTKGAIAANDFINMLINERNLKWTCIAPPMEVKPGKRTAVFESDEKPIFDDKGENFISAEDFAVAVVDELEQPKHVMEIFTVGYSVGT
jgi:uncharacterized protein